MNTAIFMMNGITHTLYSIMAIYLGIEGKDFENWADEVRDGTTSPAPTVRAPCGSF